MCPECGMTRGERAADRTVSAEPAMVEAAAGVRLAADDDRFERGVVWDGRFRLGRLLGRGGMGDVYRADDLNTGRDVTLKFLHAEYRGARWADWFEHELRVASRLTHPNVVRVSDLCLCDGFRFLVMDYVEGEDLASLLCRSGRLPKAKATDIAIQICAGLSYAHACGVLHRDVKPANILIDGDGNVRITDFGLAVESDELEQDAVRAGTPAYMAPERIQGEPATERSDIYSLGLVLYELFTGRRALGRHAIEEIKTLHVAADPMRPSFWCADINAPTDAIILRCLDKNPQLRPERVADVERSLREALID